MTFSFVMQSQIVYNLQQYVLQFGCRPNFVCVQVQQYRGTRMISISPVSSV